MVIVNAWLNQERDFNHGDAVSPPSHLAVGQGTTAALATDTALQTERFRKAFTNKLKPGVGQNEFQALITSTEQLVAWPVGTNVSETGNLTAASGGVLQFRQTFTAFARVADTDYQFEVLATRAQP